MVYWAWWDAELLARLKIMYNVLKYRKTWWNNVEISSNRNRSGIVAEAHRNRKLIQFDYAQYWIGPDFFPDLCHFWVVFFSQDFALQIHVVCYAGFPKVTLCMFAPSVRPWYETNVIWARKSHSGIAAIFCVVIAAKTACRVADVDVEGIVSIGDS